MENKTALIIGIDDYPGEGDQQPLTGCVKNALSVKNALEKNEDGTDNFYCHFCTSESGPKPTSPYILELLRQVLKPEADLALIYFSGRSQIGPNSENGGNGKFFLKAQESEITRNDNEVFKTQRARLGLIDFTDDFLQEIMESKAKNIIIILDCKDSGFFGDLERSNQHGDGIQRFSYLRKGVCILASSDIGQSNNSNSLGGAFTKTLVKGLKGGAKNGDGNVYLSSLYNYLLSEFEHGNQTPVFKAMLTEDILLKRTGAGLAYGEKINRVGESVRKGLTNLFYYFNRSEELTEEKLAEVDSMNFGGPEAIDQVYKFHELGLIKIVRGELKDIPSEGLYCKLTEFGQTIWKLEHGQRRRNFGRKR
ncbi:MAG: caspase family protein [Bacteroidia bacterium]|nr:caspase family protein [Bacteroidia bacterium]